MKKTFKVITSYGQREIYVEHFNSLEAALSVHKKACEDECEFSHLVETEVHFSGSGDFVNKILEV